MQQYFPTTVLRDALLQIAHLCGKRYTDPHSWEHTILGYRDLFSALREVLKKAGT
jgi:hypothetical protein